MRRAVCIGSRPGLAVLFPAGPSRPQGPCHLRRVRRRRPEAGCAGRGHWGKERWPLTAAQGPGAGGRLDYRGDTHRPGRTGRPHPGHLRPGRTGPDGSVIKRASPLARRCVPSPLTAQPAQPRFLRTEPGDPSSAGCPRLAPTPFPGHLPLFPLFPSPIPPTPTGMENTSRGWGRAGARLSEGQPTVTNSRRGFGGAGFPAANPEACR
ncbi:uncharacterized protein LOC144369383 [Ictidomys tridecemlineatus]